ncbi:LysR family transcriptional regulator [Dyella flagellata]
MHVSLRRLDLNLLLVFDALFRHRSVAAAADELSMSPSACSHALSRMRDALSDELFVRSGSTMQPTAQAQLMADGIGDALRILSDRLGSSAPFLPASSTQTFVFAATDYTAYALLPALIARIEGLAPHLRVKVIYATHQDSLGEMKEGRIHFALGVSHDRVAAHEGVEVLDCYTDDYIVAARHDHPRVAGSLSLEQYLAERHVAVLPWSDSGSVIDAVLARQGIQRDVAVQLPSLMAAPFLVMRTDLLITLPRRAALQFSKVAHLRLHAAPFETPRYTLKMFCHARHQSMPGHRWLREQMRLALSEELDAELE